MLKSGDRVRVLKRGENSLVFNEIGKGVVLAVASGKHSDWIKYLDRDWPSVECGEWICVNSSRVQVRKI